jgi:hypothetical protein
VTRVVRGVLTALDAVVGLTALGGGVSLMTGIDAFPASWLEGTPFSSYVVPGLILATAVGGSAIAASIAVAASRRFGAVASIVAGVVLMGWIIGEVLLLKQPSAPTWIEGLYFTAGIAIAGLALVLRRLTRR